MVAKGGAGEEFMQTASEVRPVGRCDKPPSAQERGPGGAAKKRTGGIQEGIISY